MRIAWIDDHWTHYNWRPDVRALVNRVENRFRTKANTYNEHPSNWRPKLDAVRKWAVYRRIYTCLHRLLACSVRSGATHMAKKRGSLTVSHRPSTCWNLT